jgi:regulator of RNase E activity RraB
MKTAIIIVLILLTGWKLYSSKIHNPTMVDKDQDVINNLIKHGSDPEKDHIIEFAFTGEWPKMNLIRDMLLTQGYAQDITQTNEMLIMTKTHKLHFDEIKADTTKMEKLAKEYDIEFDGWGAVIVK